MIDEKRLIEDIDNCVVGLTNILMMQIADIIETQPKVGEWIPFKQREADEEEKEAYGWEKVLCCKLPDEDEEILVSYASGHVDTDIFLCDGTECYLESGAEFVTEAIAWQPKPPAYKGE